MIYAAGCCISHNHQTTCDINANIKIVSFVAFYHIFTTVGNNVKKAANKNHRRIDQCGIQNLLDKALSSSFLLYRVDYIAFDKAFSGKFY